ncbi:MAG: Jag N-terminal domain-containing protein [Deltaproteobacteria bacterium]|nr:Jag N-terminal domain-containing protein [Deltaproteobacteria bacterium]
MSDLTFEGKTLEEAIALAEKTLGRNRESLTIEVLEDKSKGLLGISWGKKAAIRVIKDAGGEAERQDRGSLAGEEASAAKEALEKLLLLTSLKGKVDAKETFDEIILMVSLSETEESLFIGRKGKNLDAYQYLVNKIADNLRATRGKRIVVDCADYRARRKAKLEGMARKAIYSVKKENRSYTFPPMPAGERRIIHMTVKEEGLMTESKGFGEEKKVVVLPPAKA